MKPLGTFLSSMSRYIHGDRYSFIAITVLLLIFCVSTLLGLVGLYRTLPALLASVPFFVDATEAPTPFSSSVHATESPTPYSYRDCTGGEPYTATWSAEQEGMSFEAYLCPDGILIAIFHNQEIPESVKINHKPRGQLEFSWGVSVNVDSKMTTGSPAGYFEGIMGAEYRILLAHWSLGKQETVPFTDAYQVNVWQFTDDGSSDVISEADELIDGHEEFIVLRGFIPGMSAESKVLYSRFYQSIYHKLTYKTNWIRSDG